jgi:hypothetical protein
MHNISERNLGLILSSIVYYGTWIMSKIVTVLQQVKGTIEYYMGPTIPCLGNLDLEHSTPKDAQQVLYELRILHDKEEDTINLMILGSVMGMIETLDGYDFE